jgi:hypothetical protein
MPTKAAYRLIKGFRDASGLCQPWTKFLRPISARKVSSPGNFLLARCLCAAAVSYQLPPQLIYEPFRIILIYRPRDKKAPNASRLCLCRGPSAFLLLKLRSSGLLISLWLDLFAPIFPPLSF